MTTTRPVPDEDGLHPGITDLTYHADPDSLSSSGARQLLSTTPAKFHYLRQNPPKPKKEYDFGHLAHLFVLGEGSDIAVLDPAVHGLGKDGKPSASPASTAMWKAAAAEARDNGQVPVHIDEYAKAKQMAAAVHAHPVAGKLLTGGYAELSGYWRDAATGIRLRYRPDYLVQLPDGRIVCIDYKTSADASPAHVAKVSIDYGYIQADPWYRDGLIANDVSDDPGFVFVFQEKDPPYLVSVLQHHPDDVQRGRELNRAAIDLYAHCVEHDDWPGYGDGIHQIRMPGWFAGQHEARITALTALAELNAA